MPANATWSTSDRETEVRTRLVAAGTIEALIALPGQLFTTTSIPVTLWLLRGSAGDPPNTGSSDEVLFIDATALGRKVSRTQRTLEANAIDRIVAERERWRKRDTAQPYHDQAGFSRSIPAPVLVSGGQLDPAGWIRAASRPQDRSAVLAGVAELGQQLHVLNERARGVDQRVAQLLEGFRP